jgi:hypothetical protein
MNNMSGIRGKVGDYVLRKGLKKHKRKMQSCNLRKAASIGIIFNATHVFSFEVIKDFVKELSTTAKEIIVLGFVDSKQMIDHYLYRKGFEFFTHNQLNWYNKPEGDVIKEFINKEFDILFYLSLDDIYPLRYILALSKAKFKAGRYFENDEYMDFMIDIEKEKNAMKELQKELAKDQKKLKQHLTSYDKIADRKTDIELQLSFLINQLNHYLSQIKK